MNQLTITNQFTIDETLMQKVFEACEYQFTIVTPKDSESHFIAQEVSKALEYARTDYLATQLRYNDIPLLTLINKNGLKDLKLALNLHYRLNQGANSISNMTTQLILISSSSLQEYLPAHTVRIPKA